jgi:hypothetical protein
MYCILPYVSGVVLPQDFFYSIYTGSERHNANKHPIIIRNILFIIVLIRLKCSMLIYSFYNCANPLEVLHVKQGWRAWCRKHIF